MAHALTAIRLLLALPLGLLMASEGAHAAAFAGVIIVVAIATDLLDGPIARRTGTATPLGGVFDHTTDCIFVVSGMAGGAVRGVIPWLLPVLVVTAFAQYVIDSHWIHRGRGLRGSRLGRYNGILYFFPICGDNMIRVGLWFLSPLLPVVCWLLVASTCVSIAQRLMMSIAQARQTRRAEGR